MSSDDADKQQTPQTTEEKLRKIANRTEADRRQDISENRADLSDTRQDLSDTRQDLSDTRQDDSDIREEAQKIRQGVSEERVIALAHAVGGYQKVAETAIEELQHERYWRKMSIRGGTFAIIIIIIFGGVLTVNSIKVNRTTKSTNVMAVNSNNIAQDVKKSLEILQQQQEDLVARQATASIIIQDVLNSISQNHQIQIDNLRKDLQEILRQLQQGIPIEVSLDKEEVISLSELLKE